MTSIFFSETNNKTKKNGKWQANPKTITYEGIFVLSLLFSLRLLYDSCFAPWLVSFYCHVMLDDCCFAGVVCRQYSLLVFSFYFLPDCWLDSDGISNNKLANSAGPFKYFQIQPILRMGCIIITIIITSLSINSQGILAVFLSSFRLCMLPKKTGVLASTLHHRY